MINEEEEHKISTGVKEVDESPINNIINLEQQNNNNMDNIAEENKTIEGTNEDSLRPIKNVWRDWKNNEHKVERACKYYTWGFDCLNELQYDYCIHYHSD